MRGTQGKKSVSIPVYDRAQRRAEELIDRDRVRVKTDAVTYIRRTEGHRGSLPCSAENSVSAVIIAWTV